MRDKILEETEKFIRTQEEITSSKAKSVQSVVIVHGIRTRAEWEDIVIPALNSDPSIEAQVLGYGYFDAVRLIVPLSLFRNSPVSTVTKKLRIILNHSEGKPISIIAHSFGSYILSRILMRESDITFDKVILCGSIVPLTFKWEDYVHRISHRFKAPKAAAILNECGTKDIWPVVAQGVTWGYGHTGRNGFHHPLIYDRHHRFKHSDYFTKKFVDDYWLPYLVDGRLIESDVTREVTSLFINAILILKYVLLAFLVFGLWKCSA